MTKSDRLFDLLTILRDARTHRAEDLARRLGVSVRTIWRDMDALRASGVPVEGERGLGYRLSDQIALPPLTLNPDELEALNLGLAIVAEAADPDLKAAADRLAAKIDAASPERAVPAREAWKFVRSPFQDAARGFAHLPTLRAAIKARQKLRLVYHSKGDRVTNRVIRPLHLEHWGRVWSLTAWCDLRQAFRVFRVDLIQTAEALPELFSDEPGKLYSDYQAAQRSP